MKKLNNIAFILILPCLITFWGDPVFSFTKLGSEDSQNSDRQLSELLTLCYEGDAQNALESCEKLITENADLPGAWINLGRALAQLGRYNEALEAYQTAINLNPHFPNAWYNQGVVLMNLKRYGEARRSFDQALRLNPQMIRAWYNQMIVLMNLQEYTQVIAASNKPIELYLNYPNLRGDIELAQVLNLRGMAFTQLGEMTLALETFTQALQQNSQIAQIWYHQGLVQEALQQWDQALSSYQEALRIEPSLTFLQDKVDQLQSYLGE